MNKDIETIKAPKKYSGAEEYNNWKNLLERINSRLNKKKELVN